MNNKYIPLIVILGSTGTGKSNVAISLAKIINGEIVNSDSYQIYKYMDIGTGKLTLKEQKNVRHYLISKFNIHNNINAIIFRNIAREKIKEIKLKNKIPILVGGSGLYIKAIIDKIEPPPSNLRLRLELKKKVDFHGRDFILKQLSQYDNKFNYLEHANIDIRRLIRALEVVTLTGKSFFEFKLHDNLNYFFNPTIQIGLKNSFNISYFMHILQRIKKMLKLGLEEEVRFLLQKGLSKTKCIYAIGYKEFFDFFQGKLTREEILNNIFISTKKLAKKQIKWFKRDSRIKWLNYNDQDLLSKIVNIINCTKK